MNASWAQPEQEQPEEEQPEGFRYFDRELSWLDFDSRVLSLAEDSTVPLLERARFLAISASNLDEFFMIRVAGLINRMAAGLGAAASEGLQPSEELRAIRGRCAELVERQRRALADQLCPALEKAGITLCDWGDLSPDERKTLGVFFEDRVFPVLTPLAVDPGHPFPYISNLSLNLAVVVVDPSTRERRFARVKVPPLLRRFVPASGNGRLVPLEQVIAAHLATLFPGMEIASHAFFRVTRNADDFIVQEEEADDLLAAVEMELRRRRFGRAVRLEVDAGMAGEVRSLLLEELQLGPRALYAVAGPLDLGGLSALHELDRPDLKYEPWVPVTPTALAGSGPDGVFAVLQRASLLVHHPYDSFSSTVESFVRQAASDPQVLAIKATLYRTSGDSPIVRYLIRAAERGKQVAVLVELKARFEEEANIAWARALEQAGVHVVYGLVGLKTHAKVTLVVRDEAEGIRRYCHLGTGNYNSSTARLYEDVGLLSANPELGDDVAHLFNFLTGYSRGSEYRRIVVAPARLRQEVIGLILDAASVPGGRIVMKMNALVDEPVIEALYEASSRGAEIDLVVRGICRLRPETTGLSERIRVRSILGRYLEHSRIFTFRRGPEGRVRYFISSADLMPRNLDGRVEVLTPVDDPRLSARLQEILDVNLADERHAWRLRPDGRWETVPGRSANSTHALLQALAVARATGPPEPQEAGRQ